MVGIRVLHICKKQLAKKLPVKNIDTHRGKIALRYRRLLNKLGDTVCLAVSVHNTETAGFLKRNLDNGDGSIGLSLFMEGKHLVIIHFINVVTGKYQKIFRIILIYKINVLGNRVGCSAIYVESGVCFLTRRKYIYTAVLGIQSPTSAGCNITVQLN